MGACGVSIDATRWAWQQRVGRSTEKLVLLSLADRANEKHECYPSIERLALDTGCNRKTVMDAIRRLEDQGLIEAAKSWGRGTRYQLVGVADRHGNQYQKRDQSQDRDQSQKRDGTSTKNGTGPVPKTGHEPINNLSLTRKESARAKKRDALDWSRVPESARGEPLDDWTEHRKRLKAPIQTQRGINTLANELARCEQMGIPADEAISEAIDAGWRGLKAEWVANRRSGHETGTRTGGNGRATFDDKIRRLRETAQEGEPGLDSAGGNARGPILARVR
jgi:biotin operon repressor